MKIKQILFVFLIFNIITFPLKSQNSPGELSKGHAQLEGTSNCIKCHTSGNKVSRDKCLECHKEIRASIEGTKGYHAKPEVKGKHCIECHNEHHGRNFDLIKINQKNFNHDFTGFSLKGVHATKECRACHKSEFIKNPAFKNKRNTFMGLNSACLSCHADFHQGKLSSNCATCHSFKSFKNPKVVGFDHSKTKFALLGKHSTVGCIKCHKTEMVNGKPAQNFKNLQFASCVACHKDPHETKFGTNCNTCHTETSFHIIKNISTFNHDKTGFALVGHHKEVACKSCHKTESMTDPIAHNRCSNCHTDYHKGEFTKKGITPDCNECHTNNSFKETHFSIEQHNRTKFKLEGAHLATACVECHRKDKDWKFSKMGHRCVDCHKNIHKGIMSEKFMANENCEVCHSVNSWKSPKFDHEQTGFKLEGKHARKACAACHFKRNEAGVRIQKFKEMSKECSTCHTDNHVGQFAMNGKTDCTKCHNFERWEESKFNHNNSRFVLVGAHIKVKCKECHKPTTDEKGTYVKYKFKNIECAQCHS